MIIILLISFCICKGNITLSDKKSYNDTIFSFPSCVYSFTDDNDNGCHGGSDVDEDNGLDDSNSTYGIMVSDHLWTFTFIIQTPARMRSLTDIGLSAIRLK